MFIKHLKKQENMEHLASILWLISWPVLIFVTYKLARYGLKVMDKNLEKDTK